MTSNQNPTTTHSGAQKGSDVVHDLKAGIKGVHGMGEAIRGNINEAIDTAFHDKEGEAKNRSVAERGITDMERAENTLEQKRGVDK